MKKIHLLTVSGRVPAWAETAEVFYRRQLRFFSLVTVTVRPATKEKEAAALLAKVPAAARLVLFDVGGEQPDSTAFAAAVERWLQAPAVALVIAGAAGAGALLKQCADETIALSPLTFPHILARLILVEQLFRADCSLRRHPYPR